MLPFFSKLFMTTEMGFNRTWKDPSQLILWPTGRSSRSDDFEGQNGEIRSIPQMQDEFSKRHTNPLGGLLCFLSIKLVCVTEMGTQTINRNLDYYASLLEHQHYGILQIHISVILSKN